MLFWIICGLLALSVAVVVITPLLRHSAPSSDVTSDVALYRAQLAEVDRDITRGVLDPGEGERARTEIARRLLATDKLVTHVGTAPPKLSRYMGGAILVSLIAASVWLYAQLGAPTEPDLPRAARLANAETVRENRPSQQQAEAAAPPVQPVQADDAYLESVAELRRLVPTRPDDIQGWLLLARHEAELRDFSAAAAAQAQVVRLRGEAPPISDLVRQVDLMVAAANGFLSPEAETIVQDILTRAPGNIAANYYIGSLFDQTDRPDIALRYWRPIAEDGDPAQFHVALARAQIEGAAYRAGVEYTLPTLRGPSQDDIAGAADMSEADRAEMIGNMVAGLADRLATQGGTADEWARLITAYGVLGDTDNAQLIWTEAQDVFGANDAAMDTLRRAARDAGLTE